MAATAIITTAALLAGSAGDPLAATGGGGWAPAPPCPCSESVLCRPLPPASLGGAAEVVAYSAGYDYPPTGTYDGWQHVNFSAVTTIVRQYDWP